MGGLQVTVNKLISSQVRYSEMTHSQVIRFNLIFDIYYIIRPCLASIMNKYTLYENGIYMFLVILITHFLLKYEEVGPVL